MTASKVILASCVTRLEVKTIIIGATETFYVFARLLMSVNQTKSFAIVQTVHLHNFSFCRVFHPRFHHFLKIYLAWRARWSFLQNPASEKQMCG